MTVSFVTKPEQGGYLNVCSSPACVEVYSHTLSLQLSSYCEHTDISREIAAVLKLLLLEDLQGKTLCNSPSCTPAVLSLLLTLLSHRPSLAS